MEKRWSGCYSDEELEKLGIKFGKNVVISKDTKIYHPEELTIGDNVRIDDYAILTGEIQLGNYVHIGGFSLLSGKHKIKMGNFTSTAARVSIYTANDDYSNGTSLTNPTIPDNFHKTIIGKVVLEDHVLIGANTVVLPSAYLEEGVTVGAHSLVKGSRYSRWHLYTGVPAKKIKQRPSEIILRDAKKLMNP